MIETEKIMRMATPRSLIILDEVGRGTSPRDALALCYGILKYCSEKLVCRTLFATHYAQLFQLIERAKRESTEEQQQFENVAFRKTYIIEVMF